MNNYNLTLLVIGWIFTLLGFFINSALNRRLERFKIQFSKLQEKRAEVITTIYGLTIDTQSALQDYMTFGNYNKEKHDITCATITELHKYLKKNQIYFSKQTRNLLKEIIEILLENVFGLAPNLINTPSYLPKPLRQEKYIKWVSIYNNYKSELSRMLTILENDIDKILGTN